MRDALVIGGGPAGAALAADLARAGRDVVVFEREPGPAHKVCGEFVSVEAAAYLARLGIDLPRLGAVPIDTVRLWRGDRCAAAPLPFRAWSLSRRVLDEALLIRAGDLGAEVRRCTRVTGLSEDGGTWTVEADGGEARGRAAVLAVGKHDLKGWRRPPGRQSDLVGFKLHWRLAPAMAALGEGASELFLFPGGYAGLEPVEGGVANLCVLVRQGRLKALGGWDGLLAHMRRASPPLDARLAEAEPLWPKPLAVAGLPYGHLHTGGGPWRLGDQAAVIPSFAGDGLAIALHSARLAAEAILAGEASAAFHQRLALDLRWQIEAAVWLSRGMVRPWAQAGLSAAARAWPGALSLAARGTRIRQSALPSLIQREGSEIFPAPARLADS